MNIRLIYKRMLELEKMVLEQGERIEANEKQVNHFEDKMNARVSKIESKRDSHKPSRVRSPAAKSPKQPASK